MTIEHLALACCLRLLPDEKCETLKKKQRIRKTLQGITGYAMYYLKLIWVVCTKISNMQTDISNNLYKNINM